MWKCKYCLKEIEYKNKYSKSGHFSACIEWKIWKKINLTYDYLKKRYLDEEASLPEIATELGLESVCAVYKQLKKFGIKTRSCREAVPNAMKKAKKTNIERYGAPHNLCKEHPIRIAYDAKILKEYGCINSFQLESVKEKIRQTCLKKYGVENVNHVPEIKAKMIQTLKERYNVSSPLELSLFQKYTKPHKVVVEYLKTLNYMPKIEKIISNDIKYYYYDVYFDNSLKLIEINGDYWHLNPLKYKETDVIRYSKTKIKTAKEVWEYDENKIKFAKNLGYEVLVIWEYDLNNNKIITFEKIKQFMESSNEKSSD